MNLYGRDVAIFLRQECETIYLANFACRSGWEEGERAVQKKKRVELESGVAALRCSHKYEILIEKYNAINKLG